MTTPGQNLNPDFLRIATSRATTPPPGNQADGQWMGWPGRNQIQPVLMHDTKGRVMRMRTPVMDAEEF